MNFLLNDEIEKKNQFKKMTKKSKEWGANKKL
jgi:hypothetical protein